MKAGKPAAPGRSRRALRTLRQPAALPAPFEFEALEPRILMSALLPTGAADSAAGDAATAQAAAQVALVTASTPASQIDWAGSARAAPLAAAATAGPLENGGFTVTDPSAPGFGWSETGTVTTTPGKATLGQNNDQLSSLSQTFTLDPGQTTLSFTIAGGHLVAAAGQPPDAFEAALRDASTGASVLGSTGLSNTEDLLNVQADGTLFLAPGVTVSGLGPGSTLDVGQGSHLVSVDVGKLESTENLTLEFDLTTFSPDAASVTVAGVGDAQLLPNADTATAVEGATVPIDVLANDVGAGLSLTSVSAPAHGTAAVQNGQVIYTAPHGYTGTDSFTYGVTGQGGLSGTGSVTVTVTAAAAPTAAADTVSLLSGGSALVDVLANDTGVGLSLTSVTAPGNGTAAVQDGKVLYTPQAGYVGADAFSYTATDINGQTATASVAATVTAQVVAPAPAADTATAVEGATVPIDVLANDAGTGLSLTAVSAPLHGTAAVQNGQVIYTAPHGYVGTDSFTYGVTGLTGLTGAGTVTVTVTAAPPPVAAADTASLLSGGSALVDVLANDTGVGLTLTSVTAPANGTAEIQNGKVLYTPQAGYVGADAFSYTATDINGQTAGASVAVTVTARWLPRRRWRTRQRRSRVPRRSTCWRTMRAPGCRSLPSPRRCTAPPRCRTARCSTPHRTAMSARTASPTA